MGLTIDPTIPDLRILIPASLMLLELGGDQANCPAGQNGRTRTPIRLRQEILTKINKNTMSLTHHYLKKALADQNQAYSAGNRCRGNIIPEINNRLKRVKINKVE